MTLPEIAWKELTKEELDSIAQKVSEEVSRREQINSLPSTIDAMIRDLRHFEGHGEGVAWVKPNSATRSYPKNWTTHHNGKKWKSVVSGNLEEPGTTGWEEVVEDAGNAPDWVPPRNVDEAYPVNAEVSHKEEQWKSNIDKNIEEPGVKGWEKKAQNSP